MIWQPRIDSPRAGRRAEAGGNASDDHQCHRSLFLVLHLLHKIQNVERLDLAIGIVAADRVLLVGEDFEDGGELAS